MVERTTQIAPDRNLVQSLTRGLAVVRSFDAEHPQLTLEQAAERTGLSRSATRRLLQTLIRAGLASFDGHLYRLTSRLLDLGYAQQSRLSLADVAEPHCAELSRAQGRTVSVARLDLPDVLYLVRVGAPRLMHISLAVGARLPAHQPAIGRAQLAWLGDDELLAFLHSASFRENPGRTRPSAKSLRTELRTIKRQGWCHVAEELEAGLSAVAAPIFDRCGQVVAGINLSTPSDTTTIPQPLDDAIPELLKTAATIGADLHESHLT